MTIDYMATIVVRLTFDGIVRAPIETGYRPNLVISDTYFPACVMEIDGDWIEHGQTRTIRMEVIVPEPYKSLVSVGAPIEFREAVRRVGSGSILEVISFLNDPSSPVGITVRA